MSKPTAEFMGLIAKVMAGYGKTLPDANVMVAWWEALAPFPVATLQQAFAAYSMERPDFAPVPNSIAARARLLDGRPDENEAWATSLLSQDERETVVWTEEMAEAFKLAAPVLNGGDEVGARMAFKDAYSRLVAKARAAGRPVNWMVSQGWDAERRQLAVSTAVRQGLLEGPKVAQIGFSGESEPEVYPEGLKRVKELVATLEDPRAKLERIADERAKAEYEAEQAEKLRIDQMVRSHPDYQKDKNEL